ncbi:MAG: hypothetical protein RLP44_08875 [Aggregatilineales bacterium]
MLKLLLSVIVIFMLNGLESSAMLQNECEPSDELRPIWSPTSQTIVFMNGNATNIDIFTIEADGSNLTNLTESSLAHDYRPSWSPDGEQLVFSSERDGTSDIWIMNADGSDPINLTPDMEGLQDFGQWSPDGEMIAFVSERMGEADIYDIGIMNANGSNLTLLTSDERYLFSQPQWMPDSQSLIFTSADDGALWFATVESPPLTRITPSFPENLAGNAVVSSEEGSIVYTDSVTGDLRLVTEDSQNPTNLTNTESVMETFPAWSHNGETIAFGCHTKICTMQFDGSDYTQITDGSEHIEDWDRLPSWSPDDTYIAFESYRAGTGDIWVMRADGTDMQNLTCSS